MDGGGVERQISLLESTENTLGLILRALDISPHGRALDIGGAAYLGHESTQFLTDFFTTTVDALRPVGRDIAEFERAFAGRVRVLDFLPGFGAPAYDLIVLCPSAAKMLSDLRELVTLQDYLVRSGGYVICHGILPERLKDRAFLQPPVTVAREFAASFAFKDNAAIRVPAYLSNYRFVAYFARKTKTRSYLAWYVLQKSPEGAAAGLSPSSAPMAAPPQLALIPAEAPAVEPAEVAEQPPRSGARASARGGRSTAAAKAAGSTRRRRFADQMQAMLARVKRYGPADRAAVLPDVAFVPPPREVEAVLKKHEFDGLMFVNNRFEHDGRVMRTAEAVVEFGRRPLAVGSNDLTEWEVREILGGVPLVLIPNHNRPIAQSLKARQLPVEIGPRYEIWLAASAVYMASMLGTMRRRPPPFIVHSHDFRAAYACASAIKLVRAQAGEAMAAMRWLHDIHEFVRDYGIIDPTLQALGIRWEESLYPEADALSTVSGDLAAQLYRHYDIRRPPHVIYNSNRLSARHKYKGPKLRDVLGVGNRPVLVHSGNIRPGRGVEYVIEAMARLDEVHLLLITGAATDYVERLLARAAELGVRARVHLHPLLPYDEVSGFICDADIGLIPMEHYGNADVSLPNKLFDYIQAGLPIVSSDTGNIRKLVEDWPVGRLFPARDVEALAGAIGTVLADPMPYKAALRARPDILLSFAWETQVLKLFEIYKGLEAEPRPGYRLEVPEY
ncbi:MAG: glycosyltransferase [Alphaproteobacteria bacterium]|nr:glycosyltransferase [Alphaproteobacteria bacterium]